MSYNLVIVESSAKAKTIEKYLNTIPELKSHGEFKVMASFGHIRDLPMKTMAVDTSTWEVEYENMAKKKDIISKLKSAAREAKKVYLASDPDREGAAISYHLRHVLGLKRAQYERVAFHEITKKGIKEAFAHPSDIDMAEVDAQESRRILDRVVGYEVSPLLWRQFETSTLSAGRVQSAALKIIVERAREVEGHEWDPVWNCEALFHIDNEASVTLPAKAYYDNKIASWNDADDIQNFIERITTAKGAPKSWNAEFSEKVVKKNPSAPFITSTLQQEAYQRFNIPAKRTMQLAQNLYEAGMITYMRTDSTTLSQDAKNQIHDWIRQEYGPDMVSSRDYVTKNEHAQEAHECIRPTNMDTLGASLSGEWVTSAHSKLYDLIRKRAIASQMVAAEYSQVTYDIYAAKWKKEDLLFRGSSKVLIKPGYLVLYKSPEDEEEEVATSAKKWKPYLKSNQIVAVALDEVKAAGDVERPPPLYHEPTLVKVLEREGIGRPSTYATILDKLLDKGYVAQGGSPARKVVVKNFSWKNTQTAITESEGTLEIGGKEKDRYLPTSLGEHVVDYLDKVTPFLMDVKFTAEMENDLDLICHNQKKKKDVLTAFYTRFHAAVLAAQEEQKDKRPTEPKEKKELQPSKKVASFSRADVVQTRYGPALFERNEKRFVSITPFLEWRGKAVEGMNEKDVEFLLSFPITIPGSTRTIAMGPYGIYIKDGTTNLPLDKEKWEDVYQGRMSASVINSVTKPEKKYEGPSSGRFLKKKVTLKKKPSSQ